MTTIAYNHKDKQIAVDSLMTMDGIVVDSKAQKWIIDSGCIFFIAGKVCDDEMLIDYCLGRADNHKGLLPDAVCFMVDMAGNEKAAYHCVVSSEGVLLKYRMSCDMALGSGDVFALAAMDFNQTALESVEYAKTRCIYTGGKVHVFDIAKMDFV